MAGCGGGGGGTAKDNNRLWLEQNKSRKDTQYPQHLLICGLFTLLMDGSGVCRSSSRKVEAACSGKSAGASLEEASQRLSTFGVISSGSFPK